MIRKIFFGLFLLIILIVAGVTIFLMTFDLNNYRRLIEEKLSALLNRPVTVQSMEMKLAFIPTVHIQDLVIGNPEGMSSEQPFFKINQMDAVLELLPLFSYTVNIHQISIQSAELHLIKDDKQSNWTFTKKEENQEQDKTANSAKKQKNSKLPEIHLDTINLTKLLITYKDTKENYKTELDSLVLRDLHVLSGSVNYKNIPINFDINVGRLEDFLEQKNNFPVDMKVRINRATAHLNGKIGELKDFSRMKMTFMVNIPDVAKFVKDLGLDSTYAPAKPLALNSVLEGNMNSLTIKQLELTLASRDSFTLTAKGKVNDFLSVPAASLNCQMTLNDEELAALWQTQNFNSTFKINASTQRIDITRLQIDSNRSDVMINTSLLMQQTPPKLDFIFSSNYLNIADFIRFNSDPRTSAQKSGTTQKQMNFNIPWEALNKIDASVQVNIKNLVVPEDIKGYVSLHSVTTLEKGRAKWPFEINVLDGTVKGVFELDATKQSVNMQLQGRSLKLDDIRALSKDIQDVRLAIDVSLKSNGRTYQELLAQTNGQIVAELNNGYIINDWFVKLPQALSLAQKQKTGVTYSKPDAKVPLICGAANLDVKGGIIQSNKQLAMETDIVNFMIDGTADLNKQNLSVSMIPSVNQTNDKVNTALMATQVVQISGPFNNLTPSVNPVKAVGNLLQAGVQAVMGTKTKIQTSEKSLCDSALKGYKLSKTNNASKPAQKPKVAPVTTQQKEVKKEFKQQLLDSLSKALQTGTQGAY
ncbi:MAG: AsmA family protein [Alphaproteobacteria bacterium]|nr:AsmA family protein [Alphaproteobacteria bacterium]